KYIDKNDEFKENIDFINAEYRELLDDVESDISLNNKKTEELIEAETKEFENILNDIDSLKQEAGDQYNEMTRMIGEKIDHEMHVHHEFIAQENAKFLSTQEHYQEINSDQANRLMWAIEQSKNALADLSSRLEEKSSQHAAFMDESATEILHSLRETKDRVNSLFKGTTDLFSEQKHHIEQLNHERQKPHSQLNQTIVRQYVKKIREVNQKKIAFDQMIRKELDSSLEVIGERIIKFDAEKNRLETEKAILQYEIVKKKADYLLNRNKLIADSLISKYQNEIKKIKIDSFRRVEEIKLAYYMPAAFFQNSINLYSNFAFYVNESFTDLDMLLSDLTMTNKRITDLETNYVTHSAKAVEDYKLRVMAQINEVTGKLTGLITKIDTLSREIVTLESRNQLEIAEIRKKMESTDIMGDYQKHLAKLENDEYFACYQHDINLNKIKAANRCDGELLGIEQSVIKLHRDREMIDVRERQAKAMSQNEKEIRDLAYDKALAIFRAAYDRNKLASDIQNQIESEKVEFSFKAHNYLFARKYEELRNKHHRSEADGSEGVVEYVHNAQKMIDANNNELKDFIAGIAQGRNARDYAYYLETVKTNMIMALKAELKTKTEKNRKAIDLYKEHFQRAHELLQGAFADISHQIKQHLANLDENMALVQANMIIRDHAYLHQIADIFANAYDDAFSFIKGISSKADPSLLEKQKESALNNYVILADITLTALQKPKISAKKTNSVLEHYYVTTIDLINDSINTVTAFYADMEIFVKKNDISFIKKAEENEATSEKMITEVYDELIVKAARMGNDSDKKVNSMKKITTSIESELKRKVAKVNSLYINNMKTEADKLGYISKSFEKIMSDNERALATYRISETARIKREGADREKAYGKFIRDYERQKAASEETCRLEGDYSALSARKGVSDIESMLKEYEEKTKLLPKERDKSIIALESGKETKIMKQNTALMQQLAIIEGNKFSSRPKFMKEIEAIKDRLPTDYLHLYQEIQKAESDLLQQYIETETSISRDFQLFLSGQESHKRLLSDEKLVYSPFEGFLDLQDNLIEKAAGAYETAIDKSDLATKKIKETENNSKEKQDRIINE
ncbi:MAG TPA: hypothetical protein P5042_02990, partial [Candidatus Izemoplasmatales bacterium]|nr:hypothetical protein [Candidatus Izemoplasmatales bacterium]